MIKNTLRAAAAPLALLSAASAQTVIDEAPELLPDDVIVVSASPLDRSLDELLSGASVIEGEELARQAGATIGETLRLEPGVSSTSFGAGASRPIIRGLGGDRVRVLTNGIGTIDAAAASPDHAVPVEPLLAERIEVVRGTGLLRYGSSAAGGVVNVLDGRLPRAVPEGGIDGGFTVQHTTVDDGQAAAGEVTAEVFETDGFSVLLHAGGSWRDAEDYDIPGFAESEALRALEEEEGEEHGDEEHDEHEDEEEVFGTLENSFVRSNSAQGGLSVVGERGFVSVGVQRNETRYGIPAGHDHGHGHEEEEGEEHDEEEHDEEEGGVFIDLEQERLDLNATLELGGFFERIDVFAGLADYSHTEFEGPGEVGTVFSNEGWEARAEVIQSERGGWRGATGLQLRDREFSAIGEEAFVPSTTTDQIGVYTFQELRTGPWHAEAAIRYERTEHERSTDGFARDFDGFSGSLGAGYDVNPMLTLTGTVFRTERAPTTEELFSDGPHLATDAYELGDVTLGEEVAVGAEALAHLHGDWGFVTVNLFRTEYDDFVYERETGLFADELLEDLDEEEEEAEEFGELPVFAFSAADARFQGFEVFGQANLGEWSGVALTADGVLDYVDAELRGGEADGTNLPRIPPLSLTLGATAEGYGGSFRAEVEHAAEQDDTAAFELPTDSYTLLNLYAAYELVPGVELRAAVLNATDEEARVHTSFLKEEVPLPGRNFRVSVGVAF